MKKWVITALFCVIAFPSYSATLMEQAKAGNIAAAYQLAENYENQHDIKNAMLWYKKAAELAMNNESSLIVENNILPQTTTHTLAEVNVTPKIDDPLDNDDLAIYQDYEKKDNIIRFMDSTFGLRPYHSNYLLPITYDAKSHQDGRRDIETTFQISFKKDVLTNALGFNETFGFAYTQRSWWQITDSSSPFRETNYLPEVYMQMPIADQNSLLKGLQVGFLHESNGKSNKAGKSRSWNRIYLEGYLRYKNIFVVPRAWYKVYENRHHDDNHDIQDYLGYGDINIFVPYNKHVVKFLIRNNLNVNQNHGAIQADWTYPLGDTGLYGYVQYFYGYGESLIDYNKKTNRLGIGIALSR